MEQPEPHSTVVMGVAQDSDDTFRCGSLVQVLPIPHCTFTFLQRWWLQVTCRCLATSSGI